MPNESKFVNNLMLLICDKYLFQDFDAKGDVKLLIQLLIWNKKLIVKIYAHSKSVKQLQTRKTQASTIILKRGSLHILNAQFLSYTV